MGAGSCPPSSAGAGGVWPLARGALHTFSVEGSSVPGCARVHPRSHLRHPSGHVYTRARGSTRCVRLPRPARGARRCLTSDCPCGSPGLSSPSSRERGGARPQPQPWAGTGGWCVRGGLQSPDPTTYLQSSTVTPRHRSVGGEAGTGGGAGAGQRALTPGEVSCGCTHTGLYSGHRYHIQR